MNKAFCKEPDSTLPPRCPKCGNDGAQVSIQTLLGHVQAQDAESLGEPVYCCTTDSCDIAYFDLLERSIGLAAATHFFWPKDPAGPLCSCHGLTCDDIDLDLAEGTPARLRAVVQQAGLPGAESGIRSADGRSCVGRVQRYYMRRKTGA